MSTTEHPAPAAEPVEYYTPDVEVFEDNDALTVTADLPGVASEDLDISLDGANLTITGRIKSNGASNGAAAEPARAYRRRFALRNPQRFDAEQITAVLRHGVLELRLPKVAAAKRRQIAVTVH